MGHWKAVKRLLCYEMQEIEFSISSNGNYGMGIPVPVMYTDPSWPSNCTCRRSKEGCFTMSEAAVFLVISLPESGGTNLH